MSPHHQGGGHHGGHPHLSSASPPVSQWHNVHQQDIKPPLGHPGALGMHPNAHGGHPQHQMFPQYSWYQTADNNMNQGLLT